MNNDDKARKLKAAITGVIYYLQEEKKASAKPVQNPWSRSGREIIMQNRSAVQSRAFSGNRLRK